jgi:hypothetical protein
MDLSELRDLLDFLENQGVGEETIRRVFQRYCPRESTPPMVQSRATPESHPPAAVPSDEELAVPPIPR